MKLVTFTHGGSTRIGIVENDGVIDLSKAAPGLPTTMLGLLEGGTEAMAHASDAVGGAEKIPLADLKLEAPIHRPPKFIGVGLNYANHVAEVGIKTPKHPTLFNKQSTCIIGPGEPMHVPRTSHLFDYEGELGFVIGRRCRHVSREDAPSVIAGYLVVNDATVRDWQLRTPTWSIGKSFDTHGPIGPWLVTADEIPDPHNLRLRTWVNDELRQDSNTNELIFDCFALVEHMSTAFTLEPGDIIATGTPSGVGAAMKPPKFLVAGDRVKIEIEGLGSIENPVIDEPADTGRIA